MFGDATSGAASGGGSSLLNGLANGSNSLANLGAATSGPLSLLNSGANGGAGLLGQAKQFIQTKLASLLPGGLGGLVGGASALSQLNPSGASSSGSGSGLSSFFGSHHLHVD